MQRGDEHQSISAGGAREQGGEENHSKPKKEGCKTGTRAGTISATASERAKHQTGGLRGTRHATPGPQMETKVCRYFRGLNIVHTN